MNVDSYKSAVAKTINNLIASSKKETTDAIDMGAFISACKKEFLTLKIPIFNIKLSEYRDNVIVIELPFCKSCEIAINSVEFGKEDQEVLLYVDKHIVRRIRLKAYDAKYMNEVAMALVDYFKRYLLLQNKFER
jgi:hypothetical protein